ncbi:MAG: hypothetical protein Q9160_004148 [Pyrenula sp. 1 TL-2023]
MASQPSNQQGQGNAQNVPPTEQAKQTENGTPAQPSSASALTGRISAQHRRLIQEMDESLAETERVPHIAPTSSRQRSRLPKREGSQHPRAHKRRRSPPRREHRPQIPRGRPRPPPRREPNSERRHDRQWSPATQDSSATRFRSYLRQPQREIAPPGAMTRDRQSSIPSYAGSLANRIDLPLMSTKDAEIIHLGIKKLESKVQAKDSELNRARQERDEARAEKDEARAERDEARAAAMREQEARALVEKNNYPLKQSLQLVQTHNAALIEATKVINESYWRVSTTAANLNAHFEALTKDMQQ